MTIKAKISLLIRLWRHISQRRRVQFGLLLFLMLLASFAEILSIGAVLPFLGLITEPERAYTHPVLQPVIRAFGFLTSPQQLLLFMTIVFGVTVTVAGSTRLLLTWANIRLSFATGADLSTSIYQRTLYQPYEVHCALNSSLVISGITGKANNVIYSTIFPVLTIASSIVMLVFVLIALLAVEPVIAMMAFGGFGLIYACIVSLTRKSLLADSHCIAREQNQVIKCLQEGLGGIRDVLIDGSQETYCQIYRNADIPLRRAQGNSAFISSSPRYAMETFGMLLIIALSYSLAEHGEGVGKAIPIMGALALGAQRLLPVMQQAFGSWASIQSGQIQLQETLELLDQPLPNCTAKSITKALSFKHAINIKQLSFRYSQLSPYVLDRLDLTIPKGGRIGFIGATGSGKSTLLDIVMGLLQPTGGSLDIDGQFVNRANNQSWQTHIAHVPQAIFLADSSIEENIAFGVAMAEIDHERVRLAAQQAQIAETIEALPKRYQTIVGERGIRLSGGQRQRIGIARALYKKADVIIFDEATSALDNETEQAVMQSIDGLSKDLTLLIIAHRLSTLKNCSQIVELSGGVVRRIGTYHDLIGNFK